MIKTLNEKLTTWYVYSKCLKTGKEDFIKDFDNSENAIRHIAKCYKIDTQIGQIGEYYYFMRER